MHRPPTRARFFLLALAACAAACLLAAGVAAAADSSSPTASTAPATTAATATTTTATPAISATAATTAQQLDAYLSGKGSPMAGQGAALMASGGRWQIDPRLVVAISGAESNFGSITCAPYNAWGYGCPNGPFQFNSWAEGIDRIAQALRTDYLGEGRVSIALINLKYAPLGAANDPTGLNNNWTANVSRFLIELGGDPNAVDTGGIGGTRLLGLPPALDPSAIVATDAFSFEDTSVAAASAAAAATEPDSSGATGSVKAPDLTVEAGAPKPLVVTVKNTGTAVWSASNVRLRRTDIEPRVIGAPYGALSDSDTVAPGAEGKFVVPLAAVGASSGTAITTWQLEGPTGAFGAELTRTVAFAVPAFVAGAARIDVTPGNGGINPDAGPVSTIVVHVRNAGSTTWTRGSANDVQLVARLAVGRPLQHEGWLGDQIAADMLERSVAPGEDASFAFRVRGTDGGITFGLQQAGVFAAGDPIIVQVGIIGVGDLAQLRAVAQADTAAVA